MPTYTITEINKVQLPEFQPWTDQYGMMLDNPNGDVGGNGNLFTAHYVAGLVQKKLITPEEKERILQVYCNNFKLPGLLMRAPSKPDDMNAHDDVIGLMSADAQLNPDRKDRKLTRAVYEYGAATFCNGIDPDPEKKVLNTFLFILLTILFISVRWNWNVKNPRKFHASAWLQRRMEMIATMQMAVSRWWVNPIYWSYWAITNYVWAKSAKNDHEDDDILRYHSAMAAQGFGYFTNKICKMVHEKIHKDHGDLGVLVGVEYFNKPQHPIVNLLKGIY